MSNSTINLTIQPYGKGGRNNDLPVDGGTKIYEGTFVSQLSSTGAAVPGSTASSGPAIGVATHYVDNSGGSDGDKRVRVLWDVIVSMANGTSTDACSEATLFGSIVYMGDDHTVYDNSNSDTLQPAGRFCGMNEDGTVRVYVGPIHLPLTSTDAALVGIADAGSFTATTEVEAALQEIYQHILSIQSHVPIDLGSAIDIATGAALAVFADGASTTPGTEFTNSKTRAIRWNNHATPGAFAVNVALPQFVNDAKVITVHALVSKTGATVGDATKLTIGAYEHVVGALHDADTDFGGDTNAVTGDATAKTITELILTLAAADVHAAPGGICLTVKPKAGTLGTDDFLLHEMWLEVGPKLMTS